MVSVESTGVSLATVSTTITSTVVVGVIDSVDGTVVVEFKVVEVAIVLDGSCVVEGSEVEVVPIVVVVVDRSVDVVVVDWDGEHGSSLSLSSGK